MEHTQIKSSMDGMEAREMKVANPGRRVKNCELFLRLLAFALTLIAAVVVGVDKQTKVIPVTLFSGIPPLNVPVTAKWRYLSAFVYFVVSNAIACCYAAISLFLSISKSRVGKGGVGLMVIILDLVMVALLFSSNGATIAIGLIGYKGNSHVRWNKVCNIFDKFCQKVAAGIALSQLGSLAFLLLVVLATLNLHKRSN